MGAETIWGDGLLIPPPTLVAGSSGASLTAPTPTMATSTTAVALTIPIITAASHEGTVSRLTAPIPTIIADDFPYALLAAPAPTLSADEGFEAVLTAPMPTTVAVEINSSYITSVVSAALPELTADMFAGGVFTFANSAPMPTLEMGTKDAVLAAPMPQVVVTLLTGTVITVSATMPTPLLSAELNNPAIITAANSAATPQLVAALLAGNIIAAAFAARVPALSAQGLTGNVGTALLEATTPIMVVAGHPAYTLTFANTAPAPYLNGVLGASLAATYRTWALNLRKAPLTEYTNFPFNSYTVFNGVVIAAGSSGLVELGTQDSDAGTAIAAVATTGKESFASSLHKRIPRIYLGYSATGDLKFSTITVEGGTRAYSLPWNGLNGMQQRRVPVGKGPKSRYWQFSIENVAGTDFKLADMLVNTTTLRRRVM